MEDNTSLNNTGTKNNVDNAAVDNVSKNEQSEQNKNTDKDTGKQVYKNKTFTQDEVNELIQKRLLRDREKYEREYQALIDDQDKQRKLEERESLLRERELRMQAKEVLSEKGYPAEIVAVLNYGNGAAEISEQIESIMSVVNTLVKSDVSKRLKSSSRLPMRSEQSAGVGSELRNIMLRK